MSTATQTPQAEASRIFYVTYSPRGFSNELSVRAFGSKTEADSFRYDKDNDVNTWTVPTSSSSHRRAVADYRAECAEYGVTPLKFQQEREKGLW